jgi:hypothetical protein
MTYLIEYLGEFEFIIETLLGYVSGDQMGSFEAKKTKSKISCLGTFKLFKSWNLSSLSIEQLVMEQLEYRTVWNIEQLKY